MVISALRREKQENSEFKACLGFLASSGLKIESKKRDRDIGRWQNFVRLKS